MKEEIAIPDFLDEGSSDEEEDLPEESSMKLSETTKAELKKIADKAKVQIDAKSPKKGSDKNRKLRAQQKRSVIMLKNLPWGFFENQLREFFSQFGDISRLRLCRSKKGRTRHMAFIEFSDEDVGPIASESLHEMIIGGKIVKCLNVPAPKVKKTMFKGYSRKGKKTRSWEQERQNAGKVEQDANKLAKKRKRRQAKFEARKKKREALGLNYDFAVKTAKEVEKLVAA